jgi:hypothetical protein
VKLDQLDAVAIHRDVGHVAEKAKALTIGGDIDLFARPYGLAEGLRGCLIP